jgi:hypothetical protein
MICWQRPFAPVFVLLALLGAMAGCRTTQLPTVTAATEENAEGWACLAFRPISWSSRDTAGTAEQVRAHNAVWEAVCKES